MMEMMEDERLMNSDGGGENRDGEENGGDDDDFLPPLVEVCNIPELLQQILLKVEDVTDMKSLRLVSKQWRDLSLDRWRKTAVFSLTTQAAQDALKLTLGVHDAVPFPVPAIYRFHDKPFTQYRLEKGRMFPPELPSLENELYFWEKCGPSITYLHLPECFFKKGLYFEGLNWILRSCPNLEELKFDPRKVSKEEDAYDGTLWHEYDDEDWEVEVGEGHANNVSYRISCAIPIPGKVTPTPAENKLKSLTIYSTNVVEVYNEDTNELFTNVNLVTAFFSLIPNVKTLTMKNLVCCNPITAALYKHAKDSAAEALLQPFIRLKKFSVIRTDDLFLDLHNFSKYLSKYCPELKNFQIHSLMFSEILCYPWELRKTLKAMKEHVEEIDFKLDCDDENWDHRVGDPLKPNSCLDFYNLKFPQLTKLSLVFTYSTDDYAKFLSFDFGTLRGTPNLKYFYFGTSKDCEYFVVEKLGAQDLVKGREQSWYKVNGDEEEEEELFSPDEEIILEKMKEFHYEGTFDAEALRFLGEAMKNLKVLETVLDEETFPVPLQVWGNEKLRKLTALTMTKDALDEHVIAEQQRKYPKVEVTKKELPQKPGRVSLSSKELKALPIRPRKDGDGNR